MNAIFQLKEKAVIKQLIESSASISVQRYLNQLTAKRFGEEHDFAGSLIQKWKETGLGERC